MTDSPPKLVLVADVQWVERCKRDNAWPGYANLGPEFIPGGEEHDNTCFIEQSIWDEAQHEQLWAQLLVAHEYGHTQGYTHPTGIVSGLLDAAFNKQFGIMSFSRVVRWRNAPSQLWIEAMAWMKSTVPVATAP